jgi:hypothetical protein
MTSSFHVPGVPKIGYKALNIWFIEKYLGWVSGLKPGSKKYYKKKKWLWKLMKRMIYYPICNFKDALVRLGQSSIGKVTDSKGHIIFTFPIEFLTSEKLDIDTFL